MSWELLTAISVLALSVSVLLQRVLIHKDKTDPFAYSIVFQGVVGILLMIPASIYGLKLPGIENLLWPGIISVIAFGVGHIVYAKTLQLVEASAFSVLFATQAIWIILAGILFFSESLTFLQIVGTVLVFCSVLLLVKNRNVFSLDKGTVLGLLTGLLFGIGITAWSYVGRYTDTLSWAALSFLVTAFVAYIVRPRTIHAIRPLLGRKVLGKLIVLGLFYAVGSLAMIYAYKHGDFAIVTPLRQTSIIVTVLFALLFLKSERNRISKKLLAATICFVGVICIVI